MKTITNSLDIDRITGLDTSNQANEQWTRAIYLSPVFVSESETLRIHGNCTFFFPQQKAGYVELQGWENTE